MIIHLLRGDKNADVDQLDVFEIVFIWYEPIKDASLNCDQNLVKNAKPSGRKFNVLA